MDFREIGSSNDDSSKVTVFHFVNGDS